MGDTKELIQDVALVSGTFASIVFLPGRVSLPILDYTVQIFDFDDEYSQEEYLMFHSFAQVWDVGRSLGALVIALSSEVVSENHGLALAAGISSLVFAGSLLMLRNMKIDSCDN